MAYICICACVIYIYIYIYIHICIDCFFVCFRDWLLWGPRCLKDGLLNSILCCTILKPHRKQPKALTILYYNLYDMQFLFPVPKALTEIAAKPRSSWLP